eukprot:5968950-Prymnesium_polylepis.1
MAAADSRQPVAPRRVFLGRGAKHGIREYGGVRNTEYGNTERVETRNTGIRRALAVGSVGSVGEYGGPGGETRNTGIRT